MIDPVLFFIFPFAMALAASCDLMTMTIPNRLNIVFAILFFPAALYAGMPLDVIGLHIGAGVAMLAVGFAMFAFGWIGGGDAKFFAVTAMWLGLGALLEYALIASLLGGALTVVLLIARAYPLPFVLGRREWAVRLHHEQSGIPYGIALALAGMIVFPETAWFSTFAF